MPSMATALSTSLTGGSRTKWRERRRGSSWGGPSLSCRPGLVPGTGLTSPPGPPGSIPHSWCYGRLESPAPQHLRERAHSIPYGPPPDPAGPLRRRGTSLLCPGKQPACNVPRHASEYQTRSEPWQAVDILWLLQSNKQSAALGGLSFLSDNSGGRGRTTSVSRGARTTRGNFANSSGNSCWERLGAPGMQPFGLGRRVAAPFHRQHCHRANSRPNNTDL